MKKLFFIPVLIAFLIAFGIAFAQDAEIVTYTSGVWDYIENKTGITLTAYRGEDTELEIPDSLDDKPVTQISKELFKNNSLLESVFIPDSVTAIGANAFNGCANLKAVRLPQSLARIDVGTFRFCINLEEIDIPFTVTNIGNFAFSDCIKLKEAILLSATTIGESAFDNCQQLESVTLSRKLTSVAGYAFRDTPWLEAQTDEFVTIGKGVLIKYNGTDPDVEIPYGTTMISDAFADNYIIQNVFVPETVLQIGQYAFRDAINLESVNVPLYVTTIGAYAFDGCRSLTSVELPAGLKTIGGGAFRNCNVLGSMVIPEGVTTIAGNTFVNCPELVDVVIPASVTKIDKGAFSGSPKVQLYVGYGTEAERLLTEYEIPFNYKLQETEDFIYSQDESGVHIVKYIGNLFDVTVPAEINGGAVISIDAGAFQNNSRVRRVIIPLTVKSVGDWGFSYMPRLEAVQFGIGLEQLGSNVFTGSTSLQEVNLPKGLKTIGTDIFDAETQTTICAAEGSALEKLLQDMGYVVTPAEVCTSDEELMALWGELNAKAAAGDACDPVPVVQQQTADSAEIIRIPDDVTVLTSDMLANAGKNLILVIPAGVSEIDPEILVNHNIQTIISVSGTQAEAFAQANNIRFLVQIIYKVNID